MSNLYKQFKKYDKAKPQEVKEIGGILGLPTSAKTVEVPNQNGYVYVRLRNTNEIVRAYNGKVSPIYDLPVLIAWNNGGYAILGRDVQRYSDWGSSSSYLPKHGYQHAFTGGDTTWIGGQQFLPLLVAPLETGSTNTVYISPYLDHKADGTWNAIGGTGTADLLAYCPTGSYMARALLIYADANTGVPGILAGSYFDATYTAASQIAPYIPALTGSSLYPLGVVRLTNPTALIDWSNIYDARQFFKEGGGSGGESTIVNTDGVIIWNEGTPLGTGSVLNFIGANVDVTMSGSVAAVSITDSVGSSLNDYILIRDEKTNGTEGGTGTVNIWTARDINTEVSDVGGHCSISSGTISLASGTYTTHISAPFWGTDGVVLRLRNITDNTTELLGQSSYASASAHASLDGKFTITSPKIFEIQYIAEQNQGGAEWVLGTSMQIRASNYTDVEVYTIAEFWKVG